MEHNFEEYNVKINFPDNTLVFDREEAMKALEFTKQIGKHCLVIVSDPISNSTTSINFIGLAESQSDYNEIIDFLIDQNKGMGFYLLNDENIVDVTNLRILEFKNRRDKILIVFKKLGNKIFMSSTNSNAQDFEKAKSFVLKSMKSLS